MKNRFCRLISKTALLGTALLFASCTQIADTLESEDSDPIYSQTIDSVSISSDSGFSLLANTSVVLTSSVASVHAKEDEISYNWEITSGAEYGSLSTINKPSTVLSINKDAADNSVISVTCTATYNYGDKNVVTDNIDISVMQAGLVNASWNLICGDGFTYYTDSEFTESVQGAVTNKAAEAVKIGYFKPSTTNKDKKPRATLKAENFMRLKAGSSGTAMIGYEDMTSKNLSNATWEKFKAKGSYLTLKVYGDCEITVTGASGGSDSADTFRGVYVYSSDGKLITSINGNTSLTETEAFTGHMNDEFYIVGNSGGISNVTCKAIGEEEAVEADALWDFANATCREYTTDGTSYTALTTDGGTLSGADFKSIKTTDNTAEGVGAMFIINGKVNIDKDKKILAGTKADSTPDTIKYGGSSLPYALLVLEGDATVTITGVSGNENNIFRAILLSSTWPSSTSTAVTKNGTNYTVSGSGIIGYSTANKSLKIAKRLSKGTYYIGFNAALISSIKVKTGEDVEEITSPAVTEDPTTENSAVEPTTGSETTTTEPTTGSETSTEESVEAGTVNATWDINCGVNTFFYYTASDFSQSVAKKALGTSAVSETAYFKPETTNADGKANASLEATNFLRVKLGGNGTALFGGTPGINAVANIEKTQLDGKNVSCIKLTVSGSCSVSITGGSTGTDSYRGVFVFDSDGTKKTEIAGKTTLTTVSFDAVKGDYYIYGNGGGITNITCTAVTGE